MLMSDSHYCRAVTTSTSRTHPSPHTGRTSRQTRCPHSVRWVDSIPDSTWEEKEVEDSTRRSRRDNSAGKEVGIEDKSQVEKEMPPCPEREAVHRRQPALVASYDPRQQRRSQFFPGPHTGSIGDNLPWSPVTTRGSQGGAYSFPGHHTGKGRCSLSSIDLPMPIWWIIGSFRQFAIEQRSE
ncbi:hypothetical protein PoB_002032100 [Plakobranchus ocellatus]|uniref:Uncharacterized protein n=1 Tax=Plakobranchus ocellatus TaxID=259542 RepID=A0AAV3Z3D6_9GAST|nr:hypothetical protein PoB_002032100 [Plakobranchus ocellatus]